MIHSALYGYLAAQPAVAGIVGGRIYPGIIPQADETGAGRLPAVVYERVAVERQELFCGTDGLVQSTFVLHALALDFGTASALAAALRVSLIDYCGLWGAVRVAAVQAVDGDTDYIDDDPGVRRQSLTLSIFHTE